MQPAPSLRRHPNAEWLQPRQHCMQVLRPARTLAAEKTLCAFRVVFHSCRSWPLAPELLRALLGASATR